MRDYVWKTHASSVHSRFSEPVLGLSYLASLTIPPIFNLSTAFHIDLAIIKHIQHFLMQIHSPVQYSFISSPFTRISSSSSPPYLVLSMIILCFVSLVLPLLAHTPQLSSLKTYSFRSES